MLSGRNAHEGSLQSLLLSHTILQNHQATGDVHRLDLLDAIALALPKERCDTDVLPLIATSPQVRYCVLRSPLETWFSLKCAASADSSSLRSYFAAPHITDTIEFTTGKSGDQMPHVTTRHTLIFVFPRGIIDDTGLAHLIDIGTAYFVEAEGPTTLRFICIGTRPPTGSSYFDVQLTIPHRGGVVSTADTTSNIIAQRMVVDFVDPFSSKPAAVREGVVDFAAFASLEEVGASFLAGSGIKEVDLSPLCGLARMGAGFLVSAGFLTVVSFEGLVSLEEVSRESLAECSALEVFTLGKQPLPKLLEISDDVCRDCPCLRTVDISAAVELRHIGDAFCCARRAGSISAVVMGDLLRLETIGNDFFRGSVLEKKEKGDVCLIQVGKLPNLRSVGRACDIDAIEVLRSQ